VHVVDDDETQPPQKFGPAEVLRQNPHVQHVRVGQQDVRAFPDALPILRRRVAVVRGYLEVGKGELLQRVALILGQGFSRKQVDRAILRVLHQMLQHRQIVAKGLAAGSGGDDGDVLAAPHRVHGGGLMRVEAGNPQRAQSLS